MKYFFFFLLLLLFPFATQAASGMSINFIVNGENITLGTPPVTINPRVYLSYQEFDQTSANSKGTYGLSVIDVYDKPLANVKFDPSGTSFSVLVPYYPTIKKMVVQKTSDGSTVIDYDLGAYATCNANHTCEFEKGENEQSCIIDCGVSSPRYSKETEKILKANSGEIKNDKNAILIKERGSRFSWFWPIAGGGALIIIGGILWYVKKHRSL